MIRRTCKRVITIALILLCSSSYAQAAPSGFAAFCIKHYGQIRAKAFEERLLANPIEEVPKLLTKINLGLPLDQEFGPTLERMLKELESYQAQEQDYLLRQKVILPVLEKGREIRNKKITNYLEFLDYTMDFSLVMDIKNNIDLEGGVIKDRIGYFPFAKAYLKNLNNYFLDANGKANDIARIRHVTEGESFQSLAVPTFRDLTQRDLYKSFLFDFVGLSSGITRADSSNLGPTAFLIHDWGHRDLKLARYMKARNYYPNLSPQQMQQVRIKLQAYATQLDTKIEAIQNTKLREAVRWVTFQMIHEDSVPPDPQYVIKYLLNAQHVESNGKVKFQMVPGSSIYLEHALDQEVWRRAHQGVYDEIARETIGADGDLVVIQNAINWLIENAH